MCRSIFKCACNFFKSYLFYKKFTTQLDSQECPIAFQPFSLHGWHKVMVEGLIMISVPFF